MRSSRRLSTTGLLAVAALVAGGTLFSDSAASAEEAANSPLAAIAAVAPEVVARAEPSHVANTTDGNRLSLPAGSVLAPTDASDGVFITVGDTSATVTLPASETAVASSSNDAGVIYDNGDSSSTVVLANSDSSVTFVSVLDGSQAPSRYSYTYSNTGVLRQANDGGVTIWEGETMVGYFLNPWATDARGTAVPTHYEVTGNTLTQVVDHTSGSFEYPIIADPTQSLGGNSFYSNITLIIDMATAKNIVSVTPAPNIVWSRLPRSTGIPPYDALVPSSYEGNKFHDQLVCHWANAGYAKVPWNLDSWRHDVGYAATVAALCNPN
ncbi:uncharacterized protein DUF2599 [Rathayibacter iranicus NCPPB 2253 = VKM Ac-1602]|uniref:Uncharacterized protein DUF2599 n=1 Tax=Rathayibacter iranicus NCPPB 2253 = VKM Ac-1602 TaxID=1328868 RepID=A0ABX5LA89_9MICO|nr:uncharacterized protein DUF2599 [Rathayibacter iranicus NCPPB 2253 = VKM Ac-1602]